MVLKLAWAGCIAVVAFGCKRGGETEPDAGPKIVKCAAVERRQTRDVIEVRGTVAPLPDRDAQVAPQVAGRVLQVMVREGDGVKVGQSLARIDDAPFVDALHQTEAALARARAERQNAQSTLARIQRVYDHGIATKQEVDDATTKAASAKAAEAEGEVAARQARRQIERAVVRSPLGGVVLKVIRRAGELVDGTPATPIVQVADTSELELVADVPAHDLVRLKRGSDAEITFPALEGPKDTGKVSNVAPSVDRATGVGTVRIRLDKADLSPPVGILGTARVDSGSEREVIVVPAVAIRSAQGAEAEIILCGNDKQAHIRKVHPVIKRGDLMEVTGEIAAGDQVAVDPVLGIVDGESIEAKP